jgi:hypothetical protein
VRKSNTRRLSRQGFILFSAAQKTESVPPANACGVSPFPGTDGELYECLPPALYLSSRIHHILGILPILKPHPVSGISDGSCNWR